MFGNGIARSATSLGSLLPGITLGPRRFFGTAIVLALVATLSCGDEPIPPDPAEPTRVTVSPGSLQFEALQDTARLTAQVQDQYGNVMAGAAVTWVSSDGSVAVVNSEGLVRSVGNGEAVVTATAGSASGTASVTVAQRVTAMTISPPGDTLVERETRQLVAAASDANGNAVDVTFSWTTSTPAVATVDESGLVTAVAAGEARITATAAEVSGSADLLIVVPVPTTVTVAPGMVELMGVGDTARFSAEVLDQIGRPMDYGPVDWSTGDAGVASIDSSGLATAIGLGQTQIGARAGSAEGTAEVRVNLRITLTISPPAMTLSPGDSVSLIVEARDEAGNVVGVNSHVESSDTSVVKIVRGDLVTAVALGEADVIVRATWEGGGDTVTVPVEVTDRVHSITLTPAVDTIVMLDTVRIVAEARDADGQVLSDVYPLWNSSNYGIAGVNDAGLVSAQQNREGTAAVTATVGTASDTAWITVVSPDREPLRAFFLATNGTRWRFRHRWLTGDPLPNWYGVRMHFGSPRVRSLALPDNRLSGVIPPEIEGLTEIQHIDLYLNYIGGSIPPEIGNLGKLEGVHLSANALVGPVPGELGNLSELKGLSLGTNPLGGPIPRELGNLSELQYLEINGGELSGAIPRELGNLSRLETLLLAGNDLGGAIPREFGRLGGLVRTELQFNNLTGQIPGGFLELENLEEADLSNNRFTSIGSPPGNSQRSGIAQLFLHNNEISGQLPPELARLSNLEVLTLENNRFSGQLPAEFARLSNLEVLTLHDNDLGGQLPPEVGGMANLRLLDIRNNPRMTGPLPHSLTALGRLEALQTEGTELCAPADEGFQEWLERIPRHRIRNCDAADSELYLVQAVQSRRFPVPLVAGEAALLRVFVAAPNAGSATIPPVRATFYLDGSMVHEVEIPAKSESIPAEIDESDLDLSSNAEIPARVLKSGLEMVVEIDPDSTLDPGLGVTRTIPPTGRMPATVREVPALDLTVIPFLSFTQPDSSIIDLVNAMASDPEGHELLGATRTLMPVQDMDVTAHHPVLTGATEAFGLLADVIAIRALEGGTGHYMGTIPSVTTHVAGVAILGGWTFFSLPLEGTIAHELGHNFGLFHAPCGNPGAVDPAFPEANGSIGAWGYDFESGSLVPETYSDLMGYCGEQWISDYHFSSALRYRRNPVAAPDRRSGESLLLWGGTDPDGAPFLEPVFLADAPPTLPDSAGDYEIVGRDAGGTELFALSFAMPLLADGDGRSAFAFTLPADDDWSGSLASLTLEGPGGSAGIDATTDRPTVILRDRGSGQVRGILREIPLAAMSPPGVDVLFSRGLPAVGTR